MNPAFFPFSALSIESLMLELFSYIDQFNCCFTAGLGQRYRTYRQSICLPPTILACNVRFVHYSVEKLPLAVKRGE